METTMNRTLSAAALVAACAAFAQAQPTLVMVGMGGGDISSDGMKATGSIYDASVGKYRIYRYVRGVGASDTGAVINNGSIHSSADCSAVSFDAYNAENYGNFGTTKYIAHRWTSVTGSVNLGLQPNNATCDSLINTASDISRDGRWVIGNGYTGSCSYYRGWICDSNTLTFTQLPPSVSSPPINAIALNTRADAVNGDGTVVVGYDENFNANFTATVRRAAVWVKTGGSWGEAILDTRGGTANGVNSLGTVVVGNMNSQTMLATFGTSVTTPIKWTQSGGSWVPTNLGGTATMVPVFASDDGNTVVGVDNGAVWIWRPSINGGVPMHLDDYLTSQGAMPPNMAIATLLGSPLQAMSEDGNEIMTSWLDSRSSCLTTGNVGITYLNGSTCEAARVNFNPVSQSITAPLPPFGIILNVFASGSWPLNYQWQRESSPGVWTNLADDNCSTTDPTMFDLQGTTTNQLRIGELSGTWAGNYRCAINNSCGSVTTTIAVVAAAPPPCYANCDNSTQAPILNANDFQCFLNNFAAGTSYANCDNSTQPPILNANDFQCFLNSYAAGCP
jgi:hypothetical protein